MADVEYGEIGEAVLAQWERDVEGLRQEALNESEVEEEMGWPSERINGWRSVQGAKADWGFGEHWGKGPGLGGDSAPDELG